MKHLIKTVSFLTVMTVIPGAFGATSRVSVVGKASSRAPVSIAGYMNNAVRVVTNGTTTVSSLLSNADCISNYQSCLYASDVCGESFEECPTRMLFHIQMPKCLNVLTQCSASGVAALFGTSSINALGEPIFDTYGKEIIDYKYPTINWYTDANGIKRASTDGSLVGQWIAAGMGENMYGLSECRKKYEKCLRKDEVCGEDFELCTSKKDFKTQAPLCAAHLARCTNDGVALFYGDLTDVTVNPGKGEYSSKGLIATWVAKGEQLAAYNAVNTCYKVADQCILSACNKNPVKCMAGKSLVAALMVDDMNSQNMGDGVDEAGSADGAEEGAKATSYSDYIANAKSRIEKSFTSEDGTVNVEGFDYGDSGYGITARYVKRYIKNMCREKIGPNKYCYMTALGREPKKKTDLVDPDNMDEVYGTIYADRFNGSMSEKLEEIFDKYNNKAASKCAETIASCAMRTCGKGVGSVCYQTVFKHNANNTINEGDSYTEITKGCRAIVNTDSYCVYSAQRFADEDNSNNAESKDAYSILFPKYSSDDDTSAAADPVGAIGLLNRSLATSFNDAVIARLYDECKATAKSCVKAMCGSGYENCFRNRTDITSDLYQEVNENAGASDFTESMNKMGGVLDYTIVTGLCNDVVTTSKACGEHFKLAMAEIEEATSAWVSGDDGFGNLTSQWLDSTGVTVGKSSVKNPGEYFSGSYTTSVTNADDPCYGLLSDTYGMDSNKCNFDKQEMVSYQTYVVQQGAKKLFKDVLKEEEARAQAQEKARITKRANMCKKLNVDGLAGHGNDGGSTYAWVKLKGRLSNDYNIKGIRPALLTLSNDVYGSFCRVKVTIKGDTQELNDVLAKDTTNAYFVVGEPITCGSWLKSDTIKNAIEKATEHAGDEWKLSSKKGIAAMLWTTLGGFALGGAAGGLISNYLQKKATGVDSTGLLSNNTRLKQKASNKTYAGSCQIEADTCINGGKNSATVAACNNAIRDAIAAGVKSSDALTKLRSISIATIGGTNNNACNLCTGSDNNCTVSGTCTPSQIGTLVSQLSGDCSSKLQSDIQDDTSGNLAGSILLGGFTTAALAGGVTATVFQVKEEEAINKAKKELKETIGDHIRCYVGADEVAPIYETFGLTLD